MPDNLYASREQLIDLEDARGSSSRVALAASLLFHVGIIGFIFFRQPDTKLAEASPDKVPMVVTISNTNPQRKQQLPLAGAGVDGRNPAPEIAPEQQTEAAEQTESPDQSAADQPDPASSAAVPTADLPGNQSDENPDTPGINAPEVNNSVTAYIANYKSSLTSDWLSACLQYQNEHGVKDCPPGEEGKSETTKAVTAATIEMFETYVTRLEDNARVSRELLAEMDTARVTMEDNSIVGELSRQRYELAQAKYCQLNPGCRTFSTSTSASFATPVSNDGFITILKVGD